MKEALRAYVPACALAALAIALCGCASEGDYFVEPYAGYTAYGGYGYDPYAYSGGYGYGAGFGTRADPYYEQYYGTPFTTFGTGLSPGYYDFGGSRFNRGFNRIYPGNSYGVGGGFRGNRSREFQRDRGEHGGRGSGARRGRDAE